MIQHTCDAVRKIFLVLNIYILKPVCSWFLIISVLDFQNWPSFAHSQNFVTLGPKKTKIIKSAYYQKKSKQQQQKQHSVQKGENVEFVVHPVIIVVFGISVSSRNTKWLILCTSSWNKVDLHDGVDLNLISNFMAGWQQWEYACWKPIGLGSVDSIFGFVTIFLWDCVFICVQPAARFVGAGSWPTLANYCL